MKYPRAAADLRLFYLLLVGVGGITAHVASEYGAMGSEANGVLFSGRHAYLGIAVVLGAFAFVRQCRALARASSGRDLKRALNVGLATLPMGGRGVAFSALTAALQFAIGVSTELGEGAPIAGHDLLGGLFGAIVVLFAIGYATKMLGASLPAIVEALVSLLPAFRATAHPARRDARRLPASARQDVWSAPLFDRPPPHLQFFSSSQ